MEISPSFPGSAGLPLLWRERLESFQNFAEESHPQYRWRNPTYCRSARPIVRAIARTKGNKKLVVIDVKD
jgi:hypothetical protein